MNMCTVLMAILLSMSGLAGAADSDDGKAAAGLRVMELCAAIQSSVLNSVCEVDRVGSTGPLTLTVVVSSKDDYDANKLLIAVMAITLCKRAPVQLIRGYLLDDRQAIVRKSTCAEDDAGITNESEWFVVPLKSG